jgi:hypothetical protein
MENLKNPQGYQLTKEVGNTPYGPNESVRTKLKEESRTRNNRKYNKARHRHSEQAPLSSELPLDKDKEVDTAKIAVPLTVPEQVAVFIDEGNPNTQPVSPAKGDKEKPSTQPSEVPDIGKPDPQTPPPRAEEQNFFSSLATGPGEEESGETIEEELEEAGNDSMLRDRNLGEN